MILTVEAELLRRALGGVAHAMSDDGFYPALSGVWFRVEDGRWVAIAADNYRLIRWPIIEWRDGGDQRFGIPSHGVRLIRRMLGLYEARDRRRMPVELDVEHAPGTWALRFGDQTVGGMLMDMDPPDFDRPQAMVDADASRSSVWLTPVYLQQAASAIPGGRFKMTVSSDPTMPVVFESAEGAVEILMPHTPPETH